jgi:hypothetical protein
MFFKHCSGIKYEDCSSETHFAVLSANAASHMRSDNKVSELTTVCLLWQQWTETLVWFDDDGISASQLCC